MGRRGYKTFQHMLQWGFRLLDALDEQVKGDATVAIFITLRISFALTSIVTHWDRDAVPLQLCFDVSHGDGAAVICIDRMENLLTAVDLGLNSASTVQAVKRSELLRRGLL